MNVNYLLGVDGGGTKTDYILCTKEGRFIDHLRVGSRSHEFLPGGFLEVEDKLLNDLRCLLKSHNIQPIEVSAAFGLAGIDIPCQLEKINSILGKMGFGKYIVNNDSLLGIKAGCPSGTGICSINGTGTVASGINQKGDFLQVGGIGSITGDEAGGIFLASRAIRVVYDYYFRLGSNTKLVNRVMKIMEFTQPTDLLSIISQRFNNNRESDKALVSALFEVAAEQDEVALNIIKNSANELAKSVAGCIRNLKFINIPEVVLAGSIWTKADNGLLLKHFQEYLMKFIDEWIEPYKLDVVPAVGAVLWALEIANGERATLEQREQIIKNITMKLLDC